VIIPSIDISHGSTVQLIGGEERALDAGDPRPLLERFSVAGEVAVIDIDAARGEGDNVELIGDLCRRGPTRVGGGIRDVATARRWLDAGARRVIIGTAATPELLSQLPRERVIVSLDSRDGDVVTHGWRRTTGETVLSRVEELRDFCGGFLVTFVEREGLLGGTDLERAAAVVAAAGDSRVTVAGGIVSVDEIRELDRLGADAQVGMALYTGKMTLADAIAAPLKSLRSEGLWATVVADEAGQALGLVWSSMESLREAVETRRGVYQSRSRGLWVKGETSGATQELIKIDLDCDRDALRFTVRQKDGFCHLGYRSCWGEDNGIQRLARRLTRIAEEGTLGNTTRLLGDPALLAAKIREEANELCVAAAHEDVIAEAADLLYFTLVKAAAAGVTLEDIAGELDRRELKVSRRPMEAKEVPR